MTLKLAKSLEPDRLSENDNGNDFQHKHYVGTAFSDLESISYPLQGFGLDLLHLKFFDFFFGAIMIVVGQDSQ